jgi:hypothetical protein
MGNIIGKQRRSEYSIHINFIDIDCVDWHWLRILSHDELDTSVVEPSSFANILHVRLASYHITKCRIILVLSSEMVHPCVCVNCGQIFKKISSDVTILLLSLLWKMKQQYWHTKRNEQETACSRLLEKLIVSQLVKKSHSYSYMYTHC